MESLAELVATFAADPGGNGKSMRDLLRRDYVSFLSSAVAVVREPSDSPGFDYLLALLCGNDLATPLLANPGLLNDDEATALAPRLLRIEPSLDVRLLHFAVLTHRKDDAADFCPITRRVLGILAVAGDRRRTAPLLIMLLRHRDGWVRSRAALLLGSATRNCAWAVEQLRSPDARVRANVIESLWGIRSDESRHLFRAAATDSNNRVAGNAVIGLYYAGGADSVRLITAMAGSEDASFRSTAAWAMGKTEDPRFVGCLKSMLGDSAPGVRRNVLRALRVLGSIDAGRDMLDATVQPEGSEGHRRTFHVRVFDGPHPARDLPGTAFTCWSGEQLITDYDVAPNALSPGQYLLHARLERGSRFRLEVCRPRLAH